MCKFGDILLLLAAVLVKIRWKCPSDRTLNLLVKLGIFVYTKALGNIVPKGTFTKICLHEFQWESAHFRVFFRTLKKRRYCGSLCFANISKSGFITRKILWALHIVDDFFYLTFQCLAYFHKFNLQLSCLCRRTTLEKRIAVLIAFFLSAELIRYFSTRQPREKNSQLPIFEGISL